MVFRKVRPFIEKKIAFSIKKENTGIKISFGFVPVLKMTSQSG